ncbi:hypothetical protein ACFLZ5_11755, partial [Thermodesulfobacteriota bacterium]
MMHYKTAFASRTVSSSKGITHPDKGRYFKAALRIDRTAGGCCLVAGNKTLIKCHLAAAGNIH